MAPLDASDFLAYLFAYYRVAGGKPEHGITRILRKICRDGAFEEAYPRYAEAQITGFRGKRPELLAEDSDRYGFAAREQALWVHRSVLRDFNREGGENFLQKPEDAFADGQPFHRNISSFVTDSVRLSAWREGRLRTTDWFTEREKEVIEPRLGVELDSVVAAGYRGMIAVGVLHQIFWIGLTHDIAVVLQPDANIRAANIQQLASGFPRGETKRWIRTSEAQRNKSVVVNVPAVTRALIEQYDLRSTVTHEDHIICHGAVDGRDGPFAICTRDVLSAGTPETLPVIDDAHWTVVITSEREADALVQITLILAAHRTGARFLVLGLEGLVALWSREPALWSLHFGDEFGLHLIPARLKTLVQRTLVRGPFGHVLDACDIRHPVIADAQLASNARICVVGRPGSGKSSAIAQNCRMRSLLC